MYILLEGGMMVADSVLGSIPGSWGGRRGSSSHQEPATTSSPSQKAHGCGRANESAAAGKSVVTGKSAAASNSVTSGKNLRMKAVRVTCGMSQSDLAEAVGVTRQTIGLIEAGGYNPTLNLCCSICKVLGVTLNDLFWEE